MENWWNEKPWRLIQTNLREIDMADIDAQEYVRQLKEFGANVAMINTGGILASYDTNVEDYTVSQYLIGDSLEKIMDECHKAGIRVIARMDFSKVKRNVYETHPDWAYRSKKGEIIDYNGNVHMCPCGGYLQGKVYEIMEEAARRLPIDGVFMNMGGFRQMDYSYKHYDICHCENCKRRFREQFGMDLPDEEDMNDIVYRKYKIFQKRITTANQRRMYDMLKSINPQIAVDGFDFSRIESGTEYPRKEPQWMYNSSSVARCEKSLRQSRVCSNAAVDFIGFFFRHVAVSPNMQSLRMWQDVANYIGLDYYLMGRLDNHQDKSGYGRVKKAFDYMAKHEDVYKNMQINGDALLIRFARYEISAEACGWIRALTESHILLEEAAPDFITSVEDIKRFKAVIFADIRTVSGTLAAIMDEYVKVGGCLIITGQTGRYDGEGNERENIAFESIGAVKVDYYREDMRSSMLEIRAFEQCRFPSLPETTVLYAGDEYAYVQYGEKTERYLGLIPPHMFGPPEQCYYTQVTDLPGFTVHPYGDGKAIHIPWLPGRLYHREGYDNSFFFMKDLLMNFAGLETAEASPFTPMIEVTRGYHRDKTHGMIHLVNGTGHFGCSFFEPVEVRDINLKVALDQKPSELISLVTGSPIPFEWREGHIYFKIDWLGELEAIHVLF